MPDAPPAAPPIPTAMPSGTPPVTSPVRCGWVYSLLRVVLVVLVGFLAWYVAGHWNRWTGAARYQSTTDAYMVGDVTPLAAKVSGYVEAVSVGDYQTVHKGDPLVEIEGSDYRAQLAQAEASRAVAGATLENLAN